MDKQDKLTIKKLQKIMESLIPEYNNQAIDEFIAKGNKIEKIVLITPLFELKNVEKVRTKHGLLKIQYNQYAPGHYLMRIPTDLIRL